MSRPVRVTRSARALGRVAVVGGVMVVGVATAAGPASAHVEAGEGDYHAGSEVVVPFVVPHGCEGSPTVKLRIKIPEAVISVTPTVNANWDASVVTEQLPAPVEVGEGESVTERVTEVDYTARTPLADGYRDTFELAMALPASTAGTTLVFPTIQECQQGSTDWTQLPAEGQDPEELEHPAPSIEVSAAVEGEAGHDHGGDSADTTATAAAASSESSSSHDDSSHDDSSSDDGGGTQGLAIAGLATGVVGMILGGRALAATRRPAGPPTE